MLSKWRQHNPVFFIKFLIFQACSGSGLNLAMQAGQGNWLRIKCVEGLPGGQAALRWKAAAGHPAGTLGGLCPTKRVAME